MGQRPRSHLRYGQSCERPWQKRNTINSSIFGEKGLHVWASRAIEAGEEIFASYDNCKDCDATPVVWGTPEILREFGFVEAYPHKFYFRETETMFHYVHQIMNKEDWGKHHLEVEWHHGDKRPKYEGITWMKEEYQRLQDLQHDGTLEKRHAT
jgi:hypothetical protein